METKISAKAKIDFNVIIGKSVVIEDNVVIKAGSIIGDNVFIEEGTYVDYRNIIKDNVHIKKDSFIGANCILGEYLYDFFDDNVNKKHPLVIGKKAKIRSSTIIYGDTTIGEDFQSGHKVTIREKNRIGNKVRIGTNCDIQHECIIGNYVSMHSSVFVGERTKIEDFVWIFPHVVITNDPTPPSTVISPVIIKRYASIAAKSTILPGVTIGENSLICAAAVVSKDVGMGEAVAGVPAKFKKYTNEIINKETGEKAYPWMNNFERGMPWQGIEYDNWVKSKQNGEE